VITEEFSDSGNWIHGYAMKEYKNALYATTYNNATGVEVWRTLDGVTWSQVNSDGFGSSSNKGARMLFVLTL
jgi:hypothetical protein